MSEKLKPTNQDDEIDLFVLIWSAVRIRKDKASDLRPTQSRTLQH